MSRIVFVLLAVLAVLSARSSGQECGLNAKFNSCGTACPPTCNVPRPVRCIQECVPGCECKTGYLRKDDGSCVLSKNC